MTKDNLIRGLWTKEELRTLKRMFPHNTTWEVAYELNRAMEAVKKKASRLGLKKSRRHLKGLGLQRSAT
ncbi:MAG: hypothetical protein V2A79_10235 [Planctomycetota bacterium]